jgi:GNAT superfamily N-acetyltransferase
MITLRAMHAEDIPEADSFLKAAFGSPDSFAPRLRHFLGIETGHWLAAEENGRPVGSGGLTVMGRVGYIGLIAVDPVEQRRGIATCIMKRLLELADGMGCDTVLLDASDKGRPIYEKLGFVAEDLVGLWRRDADAGTILRDMRHPGDRAVPGGRADLDEIAAFDARAWGADRRAVLASYISGGPALVALARESRGALEGYAILQSDIGTLGPWLSREGKAASALLDWGLEARGKAPLSAYLPAANEDGARLLAANGFSLIKTQTHMRLGRALSPSRRSFVYSQANFALG